MSDWINQWRQNASSERDSNWWVNESETQLVSEREKVWINGCASECMSGWTKALSLTHTLISFKEHISFHRKLMMCLAQIE